VEQSVEHPGRIRSSYGLEKLGLSNLNSIRWNLPTPALYEEVVRRREGMMAHLGPLVVRTGHHTGRSPKDKSIVREPSSQDRVWWQNGNRPMDPEHFERLRRRLLAYLQGRDVFVQDCFAGADPRYRAPLRIITETAWHSLFARNIFMQATDEELGQHVPELTVIHAPRFHAVPELDGTNSETFIVLHLGMKLVLIGGTSYAGEIKKAVFSVLNYFLPAQNVLPMHCSANMGVGGDVALFFGLSGTGKTTLSVVADRTLLGDDEHGWSDQGVFNFEGGCYAKVVRLSAEQEPEIYQTTRRFGTVLENVAMNVVTRRVDLNDDSLTENTRAAFPMAHLPNAMRLGVGGHPSHIVMLTADAFGVLPPLARLDAAQAMYHFLSGYTAKVAGTEGGVVEPEATFSSCFGAPFMALHPAVYADLLRDRISKHQVQAWLVNTGWTGGPYGVGKRINIAYTRAMVRAVLSGALDSVPAEPDPAFGMLVPQSCPGVPPEVLHPRGTWRDSGAYDLQARRLQSMFQDNFRQFAGQVSIEVREAGPRAA